jgi:hypothetical protein
MKFRKKPVVIEAVQWFKDGDHEKVRRTGFNEIYMLLGTAGCSREAPYWTAEAMGVIDTLEGQHVVVPGDWIITGMKGEHYPCKPDIFEMTYETAE